MPTLFGTHTVNIPGTSLLLDSVLYTISGLLASDVVIITKPSVADGLGMTWDAWSPWSADTSPPVLPEFAGFPWHNAFKVKDGTNAQLFITTFPNSANIAGALAALQAVCPIVLTGHDTYKIVGTDGTPADNRGGLSLRIQVFRQDTVPSSNPPTITLVSPPEGLIASNDTITINVVDPDGDLVSVIPLVGTDGIVYDGSAFVPYYGTSEANAITNGKQLKLRRAGGWLSNFSVTVIAFDGSGNSAISVFDFTVPTIASDIAPLEGTNDDGISEDPDEDLFFNDDFQLDATGDLLIIEGVEAVRQAIYDRLRTSPGEFKVRPEYGVGCQDFVKKTLTKARLDEIRQRIVENLAQEKRLDDVVEVTTTRVNENTLSVRIKAKVKGREVQFDPLMFIP